MKIGKKELQAIFVLLGLVAIGCAYFIGYKKITEKTAAIEAENRVLKAEAEAYKMLYTRQPEFESAMEDFNKEIPEMEDEFVYGFSTEDAIIYMTNLEDSQRVEDYILSVEVENKLVKKEAEKSDKETKKDTKDEQETEVVKVEPVEGTVSSKSMVRSEPIKTSDNSIASLDAKTKVTVTGYVINKNKEKWYLISFEDSKKEKQEGYVYFDLLKIKDEIVEVTEEVEELEVAEADGENKNTKTLTLPVEYAQGSVKLAYVNMAQGEALNYVPEIETDPAFASGAISMPTVPDDGINVITNDVSFGYSVSYAGFKDMVKYLNTVGGAKDIRDISLTYDRSTGILDGYMSVDFYVLTGTDNKYVPLRIPNVDLSTDNIFGTIEFTEEDLKTFLQELKEANAAKAEK